MNAPKQSERHFKKWHQTAIFKKELAKFILEYKPDKKSKVKLSKRTKLLALTEVMNQLIQKV